MEERLVWGSHLGMLGCSQFGAEISPWAQDHVVKPNSGLLHKKHKLGSSALRVEIAAAFVTLGDAQETNPPTPARLGLGVPPVSTWEGLQ